MAKPFPAQTLLKTKISEDHRTFELTFADAEGRTRSISMPSRVAADLVPILNSLAASLPSADGPKFTKVPKDWAVGHSHHERLVLIRFDEDPPYGLAIDDAADLWREVREEAEMVSLLGEPVRQ